MMRHQALYIGVSSGKGRGVFANEIIPADTIIEVAPVIVMTSAERLLIDQTLLHDYIFEWGEDRTQCAMALGWIPVFNHAVPSNCEYFMDYEQALMFVKTVRDIAEGEELSVNYLGDFDSQDQVWFEKI